MEPRRMIALRRLLALLVFLSTSFTLCAQDRSYGRSVVATQYGMVATSQVSASQAGALILERGGTAIDAAITANAVLNVTEPTSNGMGGDLFAIYWEAKTGKVYGLNASGWAPKALTIEHLREKDITAMPQFGIDSVTVPGVVDGWAKLHDRWGKLPWRDLFQPAIFYADHGFPVAEIIHAWWDGDHDGLLTNTESRRVFLPGGKVPETGEMFRNPDVARALTLVANQGETAFYRGEIAKAILKTSDELGGTMTADDLASYSAEWVEPISTKYRDWTVYELPPNGDGIAALEMLNIRKQFKPAPAGPHGPDELHTRIEAMKLAYADVKEYDGDPRFSNIPVDQLLSKDYAAKRASLIDPTKANCTVAPGALGTSDTTYFTVVDRGGNILSVIQSNYNNFGSNVTVLGMGFALQDRGGLFSLDPTSPNALAGRKRPFHTIIPGFMERGDEHIGFGIMGGLNQAQAQAQFVSNVVDHEMNLQAALEAPRFTRLELSGCEVRVEGRIPLGVREELTKRGHKVVLQGDYSGYMGGGQAVSHNTSSHVNAGASS